MNIHKNARLTPAGRFLLVRRIVEEGWKPAAAARADERPADCQPARHAGLDSRRHPRPSPGQALRRCGLGKLMALQETPPIVRYERAGPAS